MFVLIFDSNVCLYFCVWLYRYFNCVFLLFSEVALVSHRSFLPNMLMNSAKTHSSSIIQAVRSFFLRGSKGELRGSKGELRGSKGELRGSKGELRGSKVHEGEHEC